MIIRYMLFIHSISVTLYIAEIISARSVPVNDLISVFAILLKKQFFVQVNSGQT